MKEQRENLVRIFCDFDGTIVSRDVGDAFFERFSGPETLEDSRKFRDGEFGMRALFDRYLSRMGALTPALCDAFADGFAPLEDFPAFVAWARDAGHPLLILSDGLDAYIRRILGSAGLDVEFRANALSFGAEGAPAIALPYRDEACERCGTCKRNQMLAASADNDVIVYIGDGISDFCAAAHADLVFAKGELETYCREQNISFRRWRVFDDVRGDLVSLAQRRALRRPRRAILNRQAVWSSG
jgi:2,3-diketo-5-methylthio-1-phosphopentane phosphatase